MKIKGAWVLVTGGVQGLGRQFAFDFLAAGAQVMICDVNEKVLVEAKEQAEAAGYQVATAVCDVSREDQVKATLAAMVGQFGGIDVLINNAGITRDGMFVKVKDGEIKTMSLSNWQKVIDVNLTGSFLCAREAAVTMIEKKNPGVIINISSISRVGNVGQTNYSVIKVGVAAMTVVLAKELAWYQIRVVAIAPGYTATEMVLAMRDDVQDMVKKTIPLRRFAETGEIVLTARFIVENDYLTGRVIEVDGGLRL